LSVLSDPSRSLHKRWRSTRKAVRFLKAHLPQGAAFTLLLVYVVVAVLAYFSTLQPGYLGIRVGLCGGTPCTTWVMPGGQAWDQGVRPGMAALSVDGQSLAGVNEDALPTQAISEAVLQKPTGEVLYAKVALRPIGQSPMKSSLWALGGIFALLGAAVVLRRPDLQAARVFGIFAGFASLALAVAPDSGGIGHQWALMAQFITEVGASASLLYFVTALVGESLWSRQRFVQPAPLFAGFGCILVVVYMASVFARPTWYDWVRPVLFFYMSVSVLSVVGLLAFKVGPERDLVLRHQSRLLLWGIVLSSLPFVSFTLIPEALGRPSVLPVHVSILSLALMPAFFAYAILQHQLLGIRRLVHKGMVYGITAFALLVIITFAFVIPLSDRVPGDRYPLLVSAVIVSGVLLFLPLRRAVQWLMDNLLYRDTVGYEIFLDGMHENLAVSDNSPNATNGIAHHLAEVMHLESALVFLGDDPGQSRPVALAGRRSQDVLQHLGPQLQSSAKSAEDRDYAEVRWESDSLMLVTLRSAGRYLGYLALGPKEGGEIFVDAEKRLVVTVAPFLAVAISKGQISEELRDLNQRLVKAAEMERARVASDIHDGPLQKAILLAMDGDAILQHEKGKIAHQLVSELREVSSRLRPAILDDLGIVPALEWLLENLPKRFGLATHFSLRGLNEEERFSPDVELALFRVSQESINNTTKHAGATSVQVLLSKEIDSLVLEVRDDGVGFSPAAQGKNGLGLSQMRERVVQLNGSLDVHSSPGHGTTVVARIPLGS
jgi:signal transduction histidine kinase